MLYMDVSIECLLCDTGYIHMYHGRGDGGWSYGLINNAVVYCCGSVTGVTQKYDGLVIYVRAVCSCYTLVIYVCDISS